jgi:hypothetical protein
MRNPLRRRPAALNALDAHAIQAATKRLDSLTGQEATTAKRQQRLQQNWQEEAFTYADLLGEVKYAYRYVGKAMGKLRPYPAVLDPTDQDKLPVAIEEYRIGADPDNNVEGTPLPPELIEAAQAEVARVRDSQGNIGPILRRVGENLFIVGEAFLVGVPPTGDQKEEQWSCRSISEIVPSKTAGEGRYDLKEDPSDPGTALPDGTRVIRIWSPHPKWGALADSSMRGALDTCDELLTLSRSIRGVAMSRLAGAGIFALAQELTFKQDPNAASASADGDPLTTHVMETMMAPISDPASAAAAVPLIMRVPSDMIKEKSWADHVLLDRTVDEKLITERNELRSVLAIDLDIPPEILTGKGDANHWTAWQIDEDTFKGHVEPDAQLIFDAWTTSQVRPALLEQFPQYADYIAMILVWYDATALVIRPNRSDDADKAFDRFAISWPAYRSAKGFTEEDAPSQEEIDERVKIKAASSGKPEESVPGSGTGSGADNQGPPAQSSTRALDITAAAGPGGLTHLGVRLQRIDSDLRSKLLAAADSSMRRSMERAGVKIKSRVSGRGTNGSRYGSHAAAIQGVAPERIPAILGRGMVEQLGFSDDDLIGGQFNAVGEQFDSWVADAQERTRSHLADVGVSATALAAMKQRHDTDRAAAKDSFVDSLTSTAQDRLYASSPADEDSRGEFTGTLVQMAVVRAALAIAGGAHSSEGSSGITPQGLPVVPGEAPALGVANGPSTVDFLSQADISLNKYEWVYGISTNTFEPHAALDGVEFDNWSDDVLTNGDSWPPVPYFMPGDHNGCTCDAVPTYVSVADARPEFDPSGEPLVEDQAASAGRTR